MAQNETSSSYMIPLSIIIAGAIIAGAVYLSDGTQTGGNSAPDNSYGGASSLLALAKEVGVEESDFETCLDSERNKQNVEDDEREAVRIIQEYMSKETPTPAGTPVRGVGTPFSVIVLSGGKTVPVSGAVDFAPMKTLLDGLIAGGGSTEPYVEDSISVSIEDEDYILGDPGAPIRIVEYSDLSCPFCSRFHVAMKQVIEEYGESGDVAWVYRHLPLDSLHPNARAQAEAAECVGEIAGNEAFWEYIDRIFSS